MPGKGHMTGMQGVYLVAAELTRRGFIVSPTSRSARGADLLVTDQECQKAWSVQVKTNATPASFWLVSAHALTLKSDSHAYVFVNLHKEGARPEYIVASSNDVSAKTMVRHSRTGSIWYEFHRTHKTTPDEGWSLFGNPRVVSNEAVTTQLVAPPLDITSPAAKQITKKQRVIEMMRSEGGVTVDRVATQLGISEGAACSLIGDVRRTTGLVVRQDKGVYRTDD
jgi:hypothetical protein